MNFQLAIPAASQSRITVHSNMP